MLSDDALKVIAVNTIAGVTTTALLMISFTLLFMRLRARDKAETVAIQSEARAIRTMFQMFTGVLIANRQMTPSDAADMTANASDPLYQALLEFFDKDGLELLAAGIGLSIDDVRDGPLPNVALRLKDLAERTGRHNALVAAMQLARPGLLKELR